MKKIKTILVSLCATFLFPAAPSFATDRELVIEAPEYKLEEAIRVSDVYAAIVGEGLGIMEIKNLPEAKNEPVIETKRYEFDRNKDGKLDLIYEESKVPEHKRSYDGGFITIPAHIEKYLITDDDFDGRWDRHLGDAITNFRAYGADGEYESERTWVHSKPPVSEKSFFS